MNSTACGLRVAGTIFGFVCVAHLVRVFTGISLVIADWSVPVWLNGLAALVTAGLCAWLWKLSLPPRTEPPAVPTGTPTLSAR